MKRIDKIEVDHTEDAEGRRWIVVTFLPNDAHESVKLSIGDALTAARAILELCSE